MNNYNWGGDWGPVNVSWAGHEWWFANWPAVLAVLTPLIVLVVLWSVVWKGLALWHSARRGQYWWFVVLLFVNTLGILEILYLFFVARVKWRELFSLKDHRNR